MVFFPFLDVTALAFVQIINMREIGSVRTLGDRLDSDQFRGGNGPSRVCLRSVML